MIENFKYPAIGLCVICATGGGGYFLSQERYGWPIAKDIQPTEEELKEEPGDSLAIKLDEIYSDKQPKNGSLGQTKSTKYNGNTLGGVFKNMLLDPDNSSNTQLWNTNSQNIDGPYGPLIAPFKELVKKPSGRVQKIKDLCKKAFALTKSQWRTTTMHGLKDDRDRDNFFADVWKFCKADIKEYSYYPDGWPYEYTSIKERLPYNTDAESLQFKLY